MRRKVGSIKGRRRRLGFAREYPKKIAFKVTLPEEIAWRIFTKGMARDPVRPQIDVDGNEALAAGILGLTAVVG